MCSLGWLTQLWACRALPWEVGACASEPVAEAAVAAGWAGGASRPEDTGEETVSQGFKRSSGPQLPLALDTQHCLPTRGHRQGLEATTRIV